VVIVHDTELAGESDNATGTARSELFLEALHERIGGVAFTGRGLATDVVSEEVGRELAVGDQARRI